jgi:HNH endonuclease
MPTNTAGPSDEQVALQPGQTCRPATKKCSYCKTTKPRADFSKNKNKPDGLGPDCKVCHRSHDKAYRARRTQPAKERRCARERTPAKRLRDRVGRHRRLRGGDLTVPQVRTLSKVYGYRCLCCGRHESCAGTLEIDHVVPKGPNSIGNIQPLCKLCNARKGIKDTDYRPSWWFRLVVVVLLSCRNAYRRCRLRRRRALVESPARRRGSSLRMRRNTPVKRCS